MNSHENPLATVSVGSLRIDVWYCEDRRDDNGGTRRAYGYRIDDNDPTHHPCARTDLESGVGSDIDAHAALSTLITFMTAAGEGYQHAIANPGADPESMHLFPIWVSEAAYMNSDELAILTGESDDGSSHRRPLTSGPGSSMHHEARRRSNSDQTIGEPTL
ncbi:hypothetical protein ACFX43_22210 [Nocardioides sp. YIM B13467]|uniref:hypothetical protein n=1 Tax=Nocardioides sp. YIM B13467 TaxID=3366294 RepID=UPI00366DC4C4